MIPALRSLVILTLLGLLSLPYASPTQAQFLFFPTIYRGNVTVGGQPAPDNITIVARIANASGLPVWESPPVSTSSGSYLNLKVAPSNRQYLGAVITFHSGNLTAEQTDVLVERLYPETVALDLTFPAPEPTPTPTPEPTATLEPTAVPDATPTPMPTAVPTLTPVPIPTATALLPVPGEPGIPKFASAAGAFGLAMAVAGLATLRPGHRRKA